MPSEKKFDIHQRDRMSDGEIYHLALQLIPSLFALDLNRESVDLENYDQIMELFELVRICGKRYPWILTLNVREFEDQLKKISSVGIWEDPHYFRHLGTGTAIRGLNYNFANLGGFRNNYLALFSHLNTIFETAKNKINPTDFHDQIVIAGDSHSRLVMGVRHDHNLRGNPRLTVFP